VLLGGIRLTGCSLLRCDPASVSAGMGLNPSSFNTVASASDAYHRIIEAMKFGFALRSNVGDIDFNSTWLEAS
jgi:gamma-glutamyltranspeptidase